MSAAALRPAGPGDADHLYRTYASTRTEELANVPWDEAERDAFLRMQFAAQDRWYREHYRGCRFDVIEVEGEPAGRLYVMRGEVEIRIVDIALLPEFRGHGIGTALIAGLLDEGTRAALPVTIHVEAGNRARALYERFGFASVSTTGVYTLMRAEPAAT